MAAEALEFGFQFADAFLKFWQAIEGSDSFEPLAIVDGGIAGVHRVWRNIVGDAAFGGDDGAVADGEMTGSAYLAGENAAVADFGGTGEAYLAAEHGVDADARGMADDDEIVEFGAAADASFADSGAVDAGVGLDLDVVLEDRWTGLLHFVPGAVALFGETKAICADDDSVLEDDAIADLAEFAHDGMGVREEVVADAGALINGDMAVEDGVAADVGVFFDDAIGADVRASANFGRFGDESGGMEAGLITRSLIEKFDGVSKGEVGVRSAQSGEFGHAGVAFDADAVLDEDGGGARGFEKREVAAIGEKRDLAWVGIFDSGDAVDHGFAGALETAGQLLGDVG